MSATRYPPEDHPNLKFLLLDAVDIRFAPIFDVVFSNAALHWVKDHRPVVGSIHACLKPGGRILLQMGGQGNARTIIGVLDKIMQSPKYHRYFEGFEFPYGFHGVEHYQQLLDEASRGLRAGSGQPGCPTRLGSTNRIGTHLSMSWPRAI